MTDFRAVICANLRELRGIVEYPEVVDSINDTLNQVEKGGMSRLVANFCSQRDTDQARDFLFEVWVGRMLLNNSRVCNLEYEPKQEEHPPDFRFVIDTTTFDIQVKRLRNTKNEMTKVLFGRVCERRLSRIPKPWFINFWVADEFERRHLNEFFAYLQTGIGTFQTGKDYDWPNDGTVLVRFSFMAKNKGGPGICPGFIYLWGSADGMAQALDANAARRALDRQIKKARPALTRRITDTQSNLVVMQADSYVEIPSSIVKDVLYGMECVTSSMTPDGASIARWCRAPGGLFDGQRFSRICGLILVPPTATPIDETFDGQYLPNPMHLKHLHHHPKPFESMTYCVLAEWQRGIPRRPIGAADET